MQPNCISLKPTKTTNEILARADVNNILISILLTGHQQANQISEQTPYAAGYQQGFNDAIVSARIALLGDRNG